jgi:hypothetical protein
MLPVWRLASVVALQVMSAPLSFGEIFPGNSPRTWRRYQINGRTVAHEQLDDDKRPVGHRPPSGKDTCVLDTVSARAFDDSSINMITSRNRAGTVQGIEKIGELLRLLEEDALSQQPSLVYHRLSLQSARP